MSSSIPDGNPPADAAAASTNAPAAASAARTRQDALPTHVAASATDYNVLAVCDRYACVASAAAIHLVSLSSPLSVITLTDAAASCACFDRAGKRLLTGGSDKEVRLWELDDNLSAATAPRRLCTHNKKIGCVTFSPCESSALWADLFGEVYSVALAAPASASDAPPAPTLVLGHLSPVSHLAFSAPRPPNQDPTAAGVTLLTADREGHVRESRWPHAFVIECYYLEHSQPLALLLPLRDAPLLLTAAVDRAEICVWDAKGGDGALVGRVPTAELVVRAGKEAAPEAVAAEAPLLVAAACEIRGGGEGIADAPTGDLALVAMCFKGPHAATISFCACAPAGSAAPPVRLLPELSHTTLAPGCEVTALAYCAATATLVALVRNIPDGESDQGLLLINKASAAAFATGDAMAASQLMALPKASPPATGTLPSGGDDGNDDDEDDGSDGVASKRAKVQ